MQSNSICPTTTTHQNLDLARTSLVAHSFIR
uniref:Uncharacterized protein n=1 Tax=Rhizophora mucronata TaxID=61149 RepID=A0A2P2JGJ3_RHIMU